MPILFSSIVTYFYVFCRSIRTLKSNTVNTSWRKTAASLRIYVLAWFLFLLPGLVHVYTPLTIRNRSENRVIAPLCWHSNSHWHNELADVCLKIWNYRVRITGGSDTLHRFDRLTRRKRLAILKLFPNIMGEIQRSSVKKYKPLSTVRRYTGFELETNVFESFWILYFIITVIFGRTYRCF